MKRTLTAALLAGWAVLSVSPAAQPRYDVDLTLKDKKVSDLSPQGLTLSFHIELANTLAMPLELVRYDYRVVIDEAEFLNLQVALDEPLRLEPRGRFLLGLPVKITYAYLFQAAPGVQSKDQAACFVTAGLTFQDERRREKRVPLALIADFPVYRGLDVKLLPVTAKDLTVGGADLIFRAALRNPNGFLCRVDQVTYTLILAGVKVAEGMTAEGMSLDARAEKPFEIPLLLDFFEVGKSVYDGLAQPPVAARFSGEAEVGTPWGNFKIPLDRTEKIPVQK